MTTRFRTMDQVRAFVEGTAVVAFSVPGRAERPSRFCHGASGTVFFVH